MKTESKLTRCPKDIGYLRLDEIAECYPVSRPLAKKLWGLTVEAERAGRAQPCGGDGSNGTTEIPIIGGRYDNVLEHAWHNFSQSEREEIVKATKE